MEHNRREGHQRSGYNRKRRYRDDEDSYDRQGKRRHYDEPNHIKLRKQLLGIAASSATRAEDDVLAVSVLINNTPLDVQLQNTYLETVVQLIIEQPMKIPFLAATAELINEEVPELTKSVIDRIAAELAANIQNGNWRETKLLLRFLACLQGILNGTGIFLVLDELFVRAADLQTASAEDGLGLEIVKIILLTLAYLMKNASVSQHDLATEILEKTEIIAMAPHSLEGLVDPFVTASADGANKSQSFISLLQQQLQYESLTRWGLKCISRPLQTASTGKRHDLPDVIIPTLVTSGKIPMLPEVFVSIYRDQNVETVPPQSSLAASVIRDNLVDTINTLDFNRNEAARALVELDCYFPEGTFTRRAMPLDKLQEQNQLISSWKPEDLAIDAVFSQLLLVPNPEHKMVFYHSLLTEACKIAPAAIAPSLGRAIRFMYKHLDILDLEVAYRFSDWFSHHLSNFGFTWKWTEWTEDLDLPELHPKRSFIIGALEKEIRLSFSQRIRGTLPEQYLALIPETKDKDIPDYKFNSDEVPYAQHAREILRLVRQKGPDSEVQEHLAAIEEEARENHVTDPTSESVDVYMTCICFAGAKSLSHVLNCIERCKERLLTIANQGNNARLCIIDSVMGYWKEKPGVGINIIDKLLNYTILSPMSVIQWAFVAHFEKGEKLAEIHIYEMIAGTIDKVARRIRQIVVAGQQPSLTVQQQESLDQALAAEDKQLSQLFMLLEEVLQPLTTVPENQVSGIHERSLLPNWAQKWLKTFTRKLAVEQSWRKEVLSRRTSQSDLKKAEGIRQQAGDTRQMDTAKEQQKHSSSEIVSG